MHRLLFLVIFLFPSISYSQIDPAALDSLARSIDSSARSHRSRQDSMIKVQDSIYQFEVKKAYKNQDPGSKNNSVEKREENRKEILAALVIGVLLLGLIVLLARKRTTKT